MIQTYDQILNQANKINEIMDNPVHIQKIYSTAYFLCFTARAVGKTHYLYLGRGNGYEGLWLSDEKPTPFLRQIDAFLEYNRKHLSSTQLSKIEVDDKDRIVTICYYKWRKENRLSFFYQGRRLYFSHHFYSPKQDKMQLFKSWDKELGQGEEFDYFHFDSVGRKELAEKSSKKEENFITLEKLLEKESQLAQQSKETKKSRKFIIRKVDRISEDLEKVRKWPYLQNVAKKELDFSVYDKKSVIEGIKISFKYNDHYKRRDEVFLKVKKLKKAQGILELRLRDAQAVMSKKKGVTEVNQLAMNKPFWRQSKLQDSETKVVQRDYKVFHFQDFDLGVGLSATGNDQLRKEWASKDDMWFHLDSITSSHVILKLKGKGCLDEALFRIIASVILETSKYDFQEANLLYTHVKNLKSVKGKAGGVTYKKEKRVKVYKDDSWTHYLLGEL